MVARLFQKKFKAFLSKFGEDEYERDHNRLKKNFRAMHGMTSQMIKKRAQNIVLLFLEDINKIQNCMIKMRVFNLDVQAI